MEKVISLIASVFCFGGCKGTLPPPPPINFPEKDLEWVIIYGWYALESPERLQEAVDEHFQRGGRKGESREAYLARNPWLLDRGDEEFKYSQIYYCYNERDRKDEIEASFPYLKARLYDREGNVLEEDSLSFDPKYAGEDYRGFSVHIPYHREGYRLKITKELKGKKEKLFMDIPMNSKADLIRENIRVRGDTSGVGFQYQEDSRCHKGR